MGTDSLAVRRAYTLYDRLRETGFFAGASKLYEFERALWECFAECDGTQRLVCFTLACIVQWIAQRQDGEPVTATEAVTLANALNQPFSQAMDYLLGRNAGQTVEQLLTTLTDAFARIRSALLS